MAADKRGGASTEEDFTPRMARVLEGAGAEARKTGQTRIGTEHVLLALLTDDNGIASQVLKAVADPAEIQARVRALMFPAPPSEFERYPMPWSSAVVYDASGQPKFSTRSGPMQYLVDRHQNPVRSPSGNLVHVKTDDIGRPVFDDQGKPVIVEVAIGSDSFDEQGNRLEAV